MRIWILDNRIDATTFGHDEIGDEDELNLRTLLTDFLPALDVLSFLYCRGQVIETLRMLQRVSIRRRIEGVEVTFLATFTWVGYANEGPF
ncbi:unnamed protein product [Brassica oleracea]|uniref:Uncharacterized protein n=1 Tax=Brassica oleracea var. oleracea TaxID=109376 RepID=A0A0D3EBA3_BRAOL